MSRKMFSRSFRTVVISWTAMPASTRRRVTTVPPPPPASDAARPSRARGAPATRRGHRSRSAASDCRWCRSLMNDDSCCMRDQRAERPLEEQRAAMDDADVCHELFDLREDVTRHEDGHAALAVQPVEQITHLEDAVRIEAVGRFVEDQQRRFVQQRDRDAQVADACRARTGRRASGRCRPVRRARARRRSARGHLKTRRHTSRFSARGEMSVELTGSRSTSRSGGISIRGRPASVSPRSTTCPAAVAAVRAPSGASLSCPRHSGPGIRDEACLGPRCSRHEGRPRRPRNGR